VVTQKGRGKFADVHCSLASLCAQNWTPTHGNDARSRSSDSAVALVGGDDAIGAALFATPAGLPTPHAAYFLEAEDMGEGMTIARMSRMLLGFLE